MAETLVAILLVTSSARESSLVYRWPPSPISSPRLIRSRPQGALSRASQLDNPWRASHSSDTALEAIPRSLNFAPESDGEDTWSRPHATPEPSSSFASLGHSTTGGKALPGGTRADIDKSHDHVFGYSAKILASLLCPHASMCHQKFELLVDDLAFIGHPVCAGGDGQWRFKPEKIKPGSRGRETRNGLSSQRPSASPDDRITPEQAPPKSMWLKSFHFVLVLDRPDPSSSASGNVSKYFDIIYEQIAFTLTAVLFQEQVTSNFVEEECGILDSLRGSCTLKGMIKIKSLVILAHGILRSIF